MLAFFAALLAASAQAPVLEASVPWWERVIVTVDGDGRQRSCTYQSSLSLMGAQTCDESTAASVETRGAKGPSGIYSKLTFERRFSPGAKLDSVRLQPGDKLLGQQVMFMTFDGEGTIASCRVLAVAGDMRLAYDCDEARKEQFRVPASASSDPPRQAFMTIVAYGHQEQIA